MQSWRTSSRGQDIGKVLVSGVYLGYLGMYDDAEHFSCTSVADRLDNYGCTLYGWIGGGQVQ